MEKTSSSIFSNEDFWSSVLSQDEEEVSRVLEILDEDSCQNIKSHLERMITEDGWHSSQRASALFALRIIEDLEIKDN